MSPRVSSGQLESVKMNSSIYLQKFCEYCKNEFTARTVKTRYCSHKCNSKDYKKKKREEKIKVAKREVEFSKTDVVNQKMVAAKDFMNTKEAALLLGISERTIFRLRIILREDINNLFK